MVDTLTVDMLHRHAHLPNNRKTLHCYEALYVAFVFCLFVCLFVVNKKMV